MITVGHEKVFIWLSAISGLCKNLSWLYGEIKKSVPRIIVWHDHWACRVMANCDTQGHVFLSAPHINARFFFMYIFQYFCIFSNKWLMVPENTETQHYLLLSLWYYNDIT